MMISRDEEKRKYRRADFDSAIPFQCAGQEFLLLARNISAGGLGANSNPDLAAETEGSVSIPLGPGHPPLACRCRVVYSIEGRGIGIEFLDVSDEARLALENLTHDSN